jgi:acyl-CoA synthetase (AMP-forming)/AMP-acid ligase II
MDSVSPTPARGAADPPRSLVELLRSRAALHPERCVYTFLDGDGREAAVLTYAGLDRRARALAALL